jgi:hypothetical protein
MGCDAKLRWRCGAAHEWLALPQQILAGYWCPECAALARRQPLRWEEYAASRGGKFLGYVASSAGKTRLHFQCGAGHDWTVSSGSAAKGTWCGRCAGCGIGYTLTIEEMREIARARGGECLSDAYLNNRTKLRWRCASGHEWSATPAAVKQGKWCKQCASARRRA